MSYELWDTETGNLIEAFAIQADALVAARELITANVPAYPAALALLEVGDDGSLSTIAEGVPLGVLAEQAAATRARHPA